MTRLNLLKSAFSCLIATFLFMAESSALDPEMNRWKRHTIDDSSRGADGVRLADVNGDGRLDVVTGWEEGGVVRVCFQPDRTKFVIAGRV